MSTDGFGLHVQLHDTRRKFFTLSAFGCMYHCIKFSLVTNGKEQVLLLCCSLDNLQSGAPILYTVVGWTGVCEEDSDWDMILEHYGYPCRIGWGNTRPKKHQ